jgi:hypothetical protein
MREGPRFTARALALCAGMFLGACAAETPNLAIEPAPSPVAVLEPDVAEALRRMSTTLAAAPAFTVRMTAQREERLANGQAVLLTATSAVLAQRPDHLSVVVGSDLGSFALWYDGTRVTVLNPVQNIYSTTPFSGRNDEAVAWLERRLGIDIPVRPLLAPNPYDAMMEAGPTTGIHVGTSLIGGVPVEHYALRSPADQWEIWLEANARALPRRVSVVQTTETGPSRVTVEFDDWHLVQRLPDRAFAFVPPRGAVQATMLLKPE